MEKKIIKRKTDRGLRLLPENHRNKKEKRGIEKPAPYKAQSRRRGKLPEIGLKLQKSQTTKKKGEKKQRLRPINDRRQRDAGVAASSARAKKFLETRAKRQIVPQREKSKAKPSGVQGGCTELDLSPEIDRRSYVPTSTRMDARRKNRTREQDQADDDDESPQNWGT